MQLRKSSFNTNFITSGYVSQRVFVKAVAVKQAGRHYSKSAADLAGEVLLEAAMKAGNVDLDYVVVSSTFVELSERQAAFCSYLCEYLSLEDVPCLRVEAGDAGLAALGVAYRLVDAGFRNVAVVGVEKLADFTTTMLNKVLSCLCNSTFESYYGVVPTVQAAFMTRLYMERFGYRYDDIAMWSVRMHEHAAENPYAFMRRKLTLQDILSSEVVAEPIRLFDVAPPADGAACVILSRDPSPDFRIGVDHVSQVSHNVSLNLRDDLTRLYTVEKGRDLVEHYKPTLFEVSDKYSILGILTLEALGLASRGQAPKLLRDGCFTYGDKRCVNLSGGLKCLGYTGGASGLYLFAMLVLELLGERPFDRAGAHDVGLVVDMGCVDRTALMVVLRRFS